MLAWNIPAYSLPRSRSRSPPPSRYTNRFALSRPTLENSPRTGEREEGMSDLSRRSFSSTKFTAPGYKTPRRLPSLRCLLFLNASCNVIQHPRHSARHVNAAASKYGYRGSFPFAEDTGDCLAAVSRASIVLGIYERSIGSREGKDREQIEFTEARSELASSARIMRCSPLPPRERRVSPATTKGRIERNLNKNTVSRPARPEASPGRQNKTRR